MPLYFGQLKPGKPNSVRQHFSQSSVEKCRKMNVNEKNGFLGTLLAISAKSDGANTENPVFCSLVFFFCLLNRNWGLIKFDLPVYFIRNTQGQIGQII